MRTLVSLELVVITCKVKVNYSTKLNSSQSDLSKRERTAPQPRLLVLRT